MAAIKAATPTRTRLGWWRPHDGGRRGVPAPSRQLQAAGELKLRITMQIPEENLDAAIQAGLRSGFGNEWLRIGGVKIFSDGALGARTAYMLEPFEGYPDNCGLPMATIEHLREVIGKASRAGIASFVHAIGDRANREVLDAIAAGAQVEKAGAASATRQHALRHRIEHAQIVHPDDMPRFAALGVIASMQPIHATQDMLHRGYAVGEAQRPRLCLAQPAERGRGVGFRLRCAGGDLERDEGHPRGRHPPPARWRSRPRWLVRRSSG